MLALWLFACVAAAAHAACGLGVVASGQSDAAVSTQGTAHGVDDRACEALTTGFPVLLAEHQTPGLDPSIAPSAAAALARHSPVSAADARLARLGQPLRSPLGARLNTRSVRLAL